MLKWVQVCVGSVWADKSDGGGRGVNGLKSADKLALETRCHISALAFTSKRRLSEPPVSSRFAVVCSMCVSLWEICSVNMQEVSLAGLSLPANKRARPGPAFTEILHGLFPCYNLTEVLVIRKTVFILVLSNRPLRPTSE